MPTDKRESSIIDEIKDLRKKIGDIERYGTGPTLNEIYPVGSIYISVISTNPATLFGVGTWVAFGAGKTLVGIDATQSEFDTVEETGGSKTHTLSVSEMPSHTHTQNSHSHTSRQTYSLNNGTTVGINGDAIQGGSNGAYGGGPANYNAMPQINTGSTTATNQNTGGGGSHNNLQPYIVTYMWKRTA